MSKVLCLFVCLYFVIVVYADSSIYMAPGNQTSSNCGANSQSPCYGFQNAIAEAKKQNKPILALPGIYYPTEPLYIDFNLSIISSDGPQSTVIVEPPEKEIAISQNLFTVIGKNETDLITFQISGFSMNKTSANTAASFFSFEFSNAIFTENIFVGAKTESTSSFFVSYRAVNVTELQDSYGSVYVSNCTFKQVARCLCLRYLSTIQISDSSFDFDQLSHFNEVIGNEINAQDIRMENIQVTGQTYQFLSVLRSGSIYISQMNVRNVDISYIIAMDSNNITIVDSTVSNSSMTATISYIGKLLVDNFVIENSIAHKYVFLNGVQPEGLNILSITNSRITNTTTDLEDNSAIFFLKGSTSFANVTIEYCACESLIVVKRHELESEIIKRIVSAENLRIIDSTTRASAIHIGKDINVDFVDCKFQEITCDIGSLLQVLGGAIIDSCYFNSIYAQNQFGGQIEIRNSNFTQLADVLVLLPHASLTINDSHFYDCVHQIDAPYKLYEGLFVVPNATIAIYNSSFDSIDYQYGALISYLSGVTIDSSTFSNSQGGMYCEIGKINITNSHFANIATNLFSPVYMSNAELFIDNVNFTDCSGNAGGLLFLGGNTNFTIQHSEFIGGRGHEAGALYISAKAAGIIENSKFVNCSTDSIGGALVLSGESNTTMKHCKIKDCSAMSGGALVMQERANATLDFSIIHFNNASASAGGILLSDNSFLTTNNARIENNAAQSAGGGLYIANFAVFIDYNSTIIGNTSPSQGGGIFLKDSAKIFVYQAKIIENTSNSTGGGISFSGTTNGTMNDCIIANNIGSKGGGIAVHNSATPWFFNSNITNNNATTAGGVLVTDLAKPFFLNCNFEENSSQTSAGCILATDRSNGTFERCYIGYNSALNGTGGGFLLEDFTQTQINRSLITGNSAYSGGGLMVTSKDSLSILNCNFTHNMATLNGGAMTFDEESIASVVDGYCTNNHASGRGGCISIQGIARPTISMDIEYNTAIIAGGGIYASSDSNISLSHSSIQCNTAPIGGGVFLAKTVSGSIFTCQIENNTAGVGGGAFIQGSGIEINGTNFINNYAVNGGGMSIEGTSIRLYITNCSVENNFALQRGGACYLSGTTVLPSGNPKNSIHDYNIAGVSLVNNTARQGGAIYCATKNPPTFGNNILFSNNTADNMGAAIFISGAQSNGTWITGASFTNNEATWGGCNVAWNYMSNTGLANEFCESCKFTQNPMFISGYQDNNGFATLPFQIKSNCLSYITLNAEAIDISVNLTDQFGTLVTGKLLENYPVNITLKQSGCTMTPPNATASVNEATGIAEFENLQFTGLQNSTCNLEFSVSSDEFTAQNINCSMILYGCEAGYAVSYVNNSYQTCVPSKFNYMEALILSAVFFFLMLVCILVTLAGMYITRRREKKKLQEQQGLLVIDEDSFITIADIKRDPAIPNINWKDISLKDRIGRGASGLVWSAKWNRGNGSEDIAVKELLVGVDRMAQEHLREFLCEIKIMSSLFHKKIVKFIGISVPSPQKVHLITELMHRGSLRELLDGIQFSWDLRLKFAIDAAKGVDYLHSRGLIHRDLKTSNLLINQDCVCKVADFGISTVKIGTSQDERCVGTPVYMAPEVLQNNIYSKQADVYAWGIILYELYTRKYPYSEPEYSSMHVANLTYQIAYKGVRPECSNVHSVVKQLIFDCWNNDPELRPTFSEIIVRLKRIKKMKLQIESDDTTNSSLRDLASDTKPLLPKLMTNSDGSDRSSLYGSMGAQTLNSIQGDHQMIELDFE